MEDKFFGKEEYGKIIFKALTPKYYPVNYRKYIEEEKRLLKNKLKGAKRVLEAGIGIGRLIPELSPFVKEFVGVDHADLMIKKSKEVAKEFSNVKIVKGKLEDLNRLFPENYFEFSLCVWNTLGNVKDEAKILRELSKVTSKKIFVTVFKRGTLKERKKFYKTVGINVNKVDEEEIFYSKEGLRSRSYSLQDLRKLANKAELQITDSKTLGGLMLFVELSK